ncbi:glutamate 5-kinase, partial [Flavihumibacter sediminis]|nr:glutamate 5-kinase [Flavihumibacter sediminis]
ALMNRKSLLTLGITKVEGKFVEGEVIQLMEEDNTILGVAKAKLDAAAMETHRASKNIIAAHADDIVLFND